MSRVLAVPCRSLKIFGMMQSTQRGSVAAGVMMPRHKYTDVLSDEARKDENKKWKDKLSSEQFNICRLRKDEEPFQGRYLDHNVDGIYTCVCCGAVLFESRAKYDPGTGYPSFYAAYNRGNTSFSSVLTDENWTREGLRVEALCAQCQSHLGHVYQDGPPPTGLRYSINGIAIKFIPEKLSHDVEKKPNPCIVGCKDVYKKDLMKKRDETDIKPDRRHRY